MCHWEQQYCLFIGSNLLELTKRNADYNAWQQDELTHIGQMMHTCQITYNIYMSKDAYAYRHNGQVCLNLLVPRNDCVKQTPASL